MLAPLPLAVYPADQCVEAFRWMAQGKHVGKIVLTFPAKPAVLHKISREPLLDAEGTYLITGGTGALGQIAAGELARLGAKHLVLLSRNGGTLPRRWRVIRL